MTTGMLLGGALGGALCLLLFALVPPRPQLASVVARWERQRARQAAARDHRSGDDSLAGAAGPLAGRRAGSARRSPWASCAPTWS